MLSISYLERVVSGALKDAGNDPANLPPRASQSGYTLEDAPEIMAYLWDAALCDIESNFIETEDGSVFFGAGEDYGMGLHGFELYMAGILGLNRLFPEQMYSALRFSRVAREQLGWTVCEDEFVGDIFVPWKKEALDPAGFLEKYDTRSIIQSTDDVAWIWAVHDLFTHGMEASLEDWQWLYDVATKNFEDFYSFLYDEVDEMYCGQAAGIGVSYPGQPSDGYPASWELADCVHCHSTATNALYVKALRVMAEACEHIDRGDEVTTWNGLADSLAESVRIDMVHEEGTLAFYRDRLGKLTGRRHVLGDAFTALHGVVGDEEAKKHLSEYPLDKVGAPLVHPAFNNDETLYNHSAWPYASTLFFIAREAMGHTQHIIPNAMCVARSYRDGHFYERLRYRSGEHLGSSKSLLSAASWINVCIRAGLWKG